MEVCIYAKSCLLVFLIATRQSLAITRYSFLSQWKTIQAYNNPEVVINHGFGEIPMKVDVEVKVSDSKLGNIIFKATGSAHTGDDSSAQFGGIIYAYNENEVRVMAPGPHGCSNCKGGVVYLGGNGYTGSDSGSTLFTTASVRVRAWKVCDFAKPSFYTSKDIVMSSDASKSKADVSHSLNQIPDLVIVQVNHGNGWYSDGQGTAFYSKNPYGGVLFGATKSQIHLWTPIASANSLGGVFSAKGYGTGVLKSVSAGKVRVFAWKFSDLTNYPTLMESTIRKSVLKPLIPSTIVEVTKTITESQFMVVRAEPTDGANEGMAFYAAGTAPNVADVAASNYYGGIVYGYNGKSVHLWTPNDQTKGCVTFVSGLWGNNHKTQCAQEDVEITVAYFEAVVEEPPCKQLGCYWSVNGPKCNCSGTGMEGQYCEIRVKCPKPIDHQNSHHSPSKGPFEFEDKIKFSCNKGYEYVSGSNTRQCTEDKTWNGLPYLCNPVSCGEPENGTHAIQSKLTGIVYMETVTYICEAGYDLLSGDLVRHCMHNRQWNGSKPECDRSCGEPSTPTGAVRTNSGLTFGAKATYVCLTGYKADSGNFLRNCLNSGSWDGTAPVCIKKSCGPPSDGTNSIKQYTSMLFQDIVNYTCNPGYQMVGGSVDNTTSYRQCQADERWSGSHLDCEKIKCQNITETDDNVELVSQTGMRYGDRITYRCKLGFVKKSGSLIRMCQADTTWSGSVPICGDVICPVPNPVENGLVFTFGVKYGDVAVAFCNDDYALKSGDKIRNCTASGIWSGADAVCAEVFLTWVKDSSKVPALTQAEVEALRIPKKNTSLYRRTLYSVMDDRNTAVASGIVASVFLFSVAALLVAIDLNNLDKLRKSLTSSKKNINAQSGAGANSNANQTKQSGKKGKDKEIYRNDFENDFY